MEIAVTLSHRRRWSTGLAYVLNILVYAVNVLV